MSDKPYRKRVFLTVTKVYEEALDQLVEEGIYMGHNVIIRAALRLLFQFHGIESFSDKGAELKKDDNMSSEQ